LNTVALDGSERKTIMEFSDLTEEQKAKARECKSVEDILELAKSEGIELSDEQLEAISGGSWCATDCWDKCLVYGSCSWLAI